MEKEAERGKEAGKEKRDKENRSEKNDIGFVKWFSELGKKDVSIAGGKGASLAEMYNAKFPIPPGFIVTAQAYSYFLENSGLGEKIDRILRNLDVEKTQELDEKAGEIRELISGAKMPKEMKDWILISLK